MNTGSEPGWVRWRHLAAWVLAWAALLTLGGPAAGLAHGPGHHHDSMAVRVRLQEQMLRIEIWLQRPARDVAAEIRRLDSPAESSSWDQQFALHRAQQIAELEENLHVRLDGQPASVRWEVAPPPENSAQNRDSYIYLLVGQLETPVPVASSRVELAIDNSARIDSDVWFAVSAEVIEPWTLLHSSADEIYAELERADRWSNDPRLRHLRWAFARAGADLAPR